MCVYKWEYAIGTRAEWHENFEIDVTIFLTEYLKPMQHIQYKRFAIFTSTHVPAKYTHIYSVYQSNMVKLSFSLFF